MSILVDTNVLLRRLQPDHVHHALAIDSVAGLLATGEQVYFTMQNICEFWNVVTRPIGVNGLGFTPDFALSEVGKIEGFSLSCRTLPRCMRNGSASLSPMLLAAPKCMTRALWLS
jgi:hypothetical protein